MLGRPGSAISSLSVEGGSTSVRLIERMREHLHQLPLRDLKCTVSSAIPGRIESVTGTASLDEEPSSRTVVEGVMVR